MLQPSRSSYMPSQNVDLEAQNPLLPSYSQVLNQSRKSSAQIQQQTQNAFGEPNIKTGNSTSTTNCGKRLKKWLQRWYRRLGIKHIACLTLLILYTLLGGMMFYALEHDHDLEVCFCYNRIRNGRINDTSVI